MRRWILATLLAGAAACATGENDGILEGDWGGPGLGLEATTRTMRLALPCAEGTFPGPVAVNQDGSFGLTVTVRDFHGSYELEVRGATTSLNSLEVSVFRTGSRPPPAPITLLPGVDPDFDDYFCTGANRPAGQRQGR